jgi:HlyD family secretion protein
MAFAVWKGLGIAAVLAGIGGAALAFNQLRPVTVAVVRAETAVPIQVFGLGTVEARILSRIGFKVAGTLTHLQADHGDRVAAGRILARIDASEQTARVAKARAQLASAEAAVQVAEAAIRKADVVVSQRTQVNQRRQALLARQSVSAEAAEEAQHNESIARADLLVAQSELQSAKARLDDARAQLEFDTAILAQHELRAPYDAVVVQRAKELGSVLGAGESLFTLVAPETVWVLAYVDEGRAGDIREGQAVRIRLRSLPQTPFEGTVARIGIESDRLSEERRIYVGCRNCPEAFHLAEQAEVFITTGVLDRAVLVPEAAIARFDGTSGSVWTVEDGRLQRRTVAFGRRTLDGRVEIRDGLPAGAAVAASVSAVFREGRAARIAEPAP